MLECRKNSKSTILLIFPSLFYTISKANGFPWSHLKLHSILVARPPKFITIYPRLPTELENQEWQDPSRHDIDSWGGQTWRGRRPCGPGLGAEIPDRRPLIMQARGPSDDARHSYFLFDLTYVSLRVQSSSSCTDFQHVTNTKARARQSIYVICILYFKGQQALRAMICLR